MIKYPFGTSPWLSDDMNVRRSAIAMLKAERDSGMNRLTVRINGQKDGKVCVPGAFPNGASGGAGVVLERLAKHEDAWAQIKERYDACIATGNHLPGLIDHADALGWALSLMED